MNSYEYEHSSEGRNTEVFRALWGERVVGTARAVSDGLEWTYLSGPSVLPEHRRQGVGTDLVRRALARFQGHEIFTCTSRETIPFFENLGFKRSKNSFTYAGSKGEYLIPCAPLQEYYLPLGYRYESEFYPFAGNFPVGKKNRLSRDIVQVTYSRELDGVDMEELNRLLIRAFGGEDRAPEVTAAAFKDSRYLSFAHDGERLIGCARAVSDGVSQALILNVAVDPDYQGLHLGQKILEQLCEPMKGQNIFLNTHPGGVGFYNQPPFRRNKTALLYQAHPDMPEEVARGFVLPKGYKFEDEY